MATDLEAVAKPMTLAELAADHEAMAAQFANTPHKADFDHHTEAAAAIRAAMGEIERLRKMTKTLAIGAMTTRNPAPNAAAVVTNPTHRLTISSTGEVKVRP